MRCVTTEIKKKQLKQRIAMYKQANKTYHYENFPNGPKGKTLCGISYETVRAEEKKYNIRKESEIKCPTCQIVLEQYTQLQIIYYYMEEKVCSVCNSVLSKTDMQQIMTEYINTNKFRKNFSKLHKGKLTWKCRNSNCKNKEIFTINLSEL